MNKIARVGAAVTLSLLAATSMNCAIASAGTTTYRYDGGYNFRDADVTTTIYFSAGHPKENVLLWADNANGPIRYSVTMYQGNGPVWSAASQSNRVYSVGSNVSRIVMTRDCGCGGRNGVQSRARY